MSDHTAMLTTNRAGTHIHINAGRTQHVYSIEYFQRIATGEDAEPIPADVLRVIVSEWLAWLTADRSGDE